LNARENRNIFSLDLNVPSESLSVTVLGREFQVARAEEWNARLANAVLANGSDNRVVVAESARCRVLMRRLRYAWPWLWGVWPSRRYCLENNCT